MTKKPERDPSALAGRWEELMLLWKLLFDSNVSFSLKLIPIFALIYLISPIDFIPDVALGLGQVDDIGVLLLAFTTFLRLIPPEQVARARSELSQSKEEERWVEGQSHHKEDEEP